MKRLRILLVVLLASCGPTANSPPPVAEDYPPVAETRYSSVTATLTMEGVYVFDSVNSTWNVERGIELWNDALPCDYFYISDNPTSDIKIREVNLDQNFWGDYNPATGEIRLNSNWGRHWIVPAHELGHALGAPDVNTPEDLMFIGGTDDPLPTEITEHDLEIINEDLLSCPTP